MKISCLVAEIFIEASWTWTIKTYLLPQHALELHGIKKRELSKSCLERFYLSLYVWLLYVVFS